MKHNLLLILSVCLLSCSQNAKFTYKDTVRITGGFYRGCVGETKSLYVSGFGTLDNKYGVELKTCPGESYIDRIEIIEEEHLALLSDEYGSPEVTD